MPIPSLMPTIKALKSSSVGSYYKMFMDANPLNSLVERGLIWQIMEIGKASIVTELSESLKVKYENYMLRANIESWWHTLLAMHYGNDHLHGKNLSSLGRPTFLLWLEKKNERVPRSNLEEQEYIRVCGLITPP